MKKLLNAYGIELEVRLPDLSGDEQTLRQLALWTLVPIHTRRAARESAECPHFAARPTLTYAHRFATVMWNARQRAGSDGFNPDRLLLRHFVVRLSRVSGCRVDGLRRSTWST
jgi:hypothetical protein